MHDSLELRLRAVEDHEAIRALKAFYARRADEKYTESHERRPQAEINVITCRHAVHLEIHYAAGAAVAGESQRSVHRVTVSVCLKKLQHPCSFAAGYRYCCIMRHGRGIVRRRGQIDRRRQ
jgi:hypothetical protein